MPRQCSLQMDQVKYEMAGKKRLQTPPVWHFAKRTKVPMQANRAVCSREQYAMIGEVEISGISFVIA